MTQIQEDLEKIPLTTNLLGFTAQHVLFGAPDSNQTCCQDLVRYRDQLVNLRAEIGSRHSDICQLWLHNKLSDLQAASAFDNLIRAIMGPVS